MKRILTFLVLLVCLPVFGQRFVEELPSRAALKARNIGGINKSVFIKYLVTPGDNLGGIYSITNTATGADDFYRIQSSQNPAWSYDRWLVPPPPLGTTLNFNSNQFVLSGTNVSLSTNLSVTNLVIAGGTTMTPVQLGSVCGTRDVNAGAGDEFNLLLTCDSTLNMTNWPDAHDVRITLTNTGNFSLMITSSYPRYRYATGDSSQVTNDWGVGVVNMLALWKTGGRVLASEKEGLAGGIASSGNWLAVGYTNSSLAGTASLNSIDITNTVFLQGITPARFIGVSAGGQVVSSLSSARLSDTLTDELGTGQAVFASALTNYGTLNPTDTVLPYRSNATTFADSPLYVNAHTNVALDTKFIWGPGTTNVLYRSGGNLIYTNGSTIVDGVQFKVINGGGVTASFGVDQDQVPWAGASLGKAFRIEPDSGGASASVYNFSSIALYPTATGTNLDLGLPSKPWQDIYLNRKLVWNGTTNTVFDAAGNGSPESVVTASPGSTWRRYDGGAGTCFYVKESGVSTSTGWIAK